MLSKRQPPPKLEVCEFFQERREYMWNGNEGYRFQENPLYQRILARNRYPDNEHVALRESTNHSAQEQLPFCGDKRTQSAKIICLSSPNSMPRRPSHSHMVGCPADRYYDHSKQRSGESSVRQHLENIAASPSANTECSLNRDSRPKCALNSQTANGGCRERKTGDRCMQSGSENITVRSAGKTARPSPPNQEVASLEKSNEKVTRKTSNKNTKKSYPNSMITPIQESSGHLAGEPRSRQIEQASPHPTVEIGSGPTEGTSGKPARERRRPPLQETSDPLASETRLALVIETSGEPDREMRSHPIAQTSGHPARKKSSRPSGQPAMKTRSRILEQTSANPAKETGSGPIQLNSGYPDRETRSRIHMKQTSGAFKRERRAGRIQEISGPPMGSVVIQQISSQKAKETRAQAIAQTESTLHGQYQGKAPKRVRRTGR